jgi:hypothetical protein
MRDNPIFNRYLDHVVLWLIQNDIIFTKSFKEFAAPIIDKIETYSKNANCSCKTDIQMYVRVNFEIVKNFVVYFLEKNPQVKVDLESIEKTHRVTNVRGQVFRIAKNDKAFNQFYKHAVDNKFQYGNFSVVPDGDSWAIFFL